MSIRHQLRAIVGQSGEIFPCVFQKIGTKTMPEDLESRTIRDFGEQWNAFSKNEGFYGSAELFFDAFPLVTTSDVEKAVVLDVGSGTGRIVRMLLSIGADHVIAVEPSSAFSVLQQNLQDCRERVTCLKRRCEDLELDREVDLVVSYGVFHHIPDPVPPLQAAFRCLKPGGKICVWLYGKEGNELYLACIRPLRLIATKLPHSMLQALCYGFDLTLGVYVFACRFVPLPMRGYMKEIVSHLSPEQRRLVIYDQLNPAYAKYYTGDEACELLRQGGFKDIQCCHRHGYSWTVAGTKPNRES
jgi:SAM-dependent methyltransferase